MAATPGRLLGWAGPGGPAPGLFSARHGQPRSATGGAARLGTARLGTGQLSSGRDGTGAGCQRPRAALGSRRGSQALGHEPSSSSGCRAGLLPAPCRWGGTGRAALALPSRGTRTPAPRAGRREAAAGAAAAGERAGSRRLGGGAGTGTGTGGVLGLGAVRGMGPGPGLGLGLGLVPGHPGSPGLAGSAACRPETLKQLSSRQRGVLRERSREGLAGLESDEGDVPGCELARLSENVKLFPGKGSRAISLHTDPGTFL